MPSKGLKHAYNCRTSEKEGEEMTSELYRQIGQLKVELEWLKKKSLMLQLKRKER